MDRKKKDLTATTNLICEAVESLENLLYKYHGEIEDQSGKLQDRLENALQKMFDCRDDLKDYLDTL